MFNVLCELHFWSQKDGIVVDNSDFGAFMYQDRKPSTSCPFHEGKKSYCDGRGMAFSLQNKRPKKLRDALTEFEEFFYDNRVVRLDWKCPTVVRVVFDNGLQSYVKVNPHSGDPEEFVHDKFMVGKLSSNYISDVAIYSHHAVFAHSDNHVMHAYMSKPSFRNSSTKKWNALEVKLQQIALAGPLGRRLDKVLSFNIAGDMILMWWKCGKDEVYPWSPKVKAEDRANVHIYSLNGSKFDLVSFYRTKFDPVSIVFSKVHHSTIYTIQQRVTDGGDVTLEWENAQLDCRILQNNYSLSLPLPTHISALALSPQEDKLLATCVDGSLLVADNYGNITNRIRTDLIPSLATWHPDGALILIGNIKGQFQWFDSALANVSCQIVNHDTHSTTLDVGSYFKYQPNLVDVHWNRSNLLPYDDYHDLLILQFAKGPLVLLKMLKPQEKRLYADVIVYHYLSCGAYNNALNLLHTIDWEVESELAMSTLQSIISFLMRQPLSPSTESTIEKSLGYFLSPIRPIPHSITSEVGDGVIDLARKFFHLLLRFQSFDKAFRLAIDLGKRDLFIDLHYYCKDVGNHVMAAAAWERADDLLCSSCGDGSESSSECSDSHSSNYNSGSSGSESESIQELQDQILPPLPIRSPLELSRNKVCYSSILQQHNYRRNPPKLSPPQYLLPSNSVKAPDVYAPLFPSTTDYNRQEVKELYLPGPNENEYSLSDDSCVIHHSNIPSSRAPLQFNAQPTERDLNNHFSHLDISNDSLCSKVLLGLNSDQDVGIPYTLKVANVRRKTMNSTTLSNGEISRLTTSNIPNGTFSKESVYNHACSLPNSVPITPTLETTLTMTQPEGLFKNRYIPEIHLDANLVEPPKELHNGQKSTECYNTYGTTTKSGNSKINVNIPFPQNLYTLGTSTKTSNSSDPIVKRTEHPIIASAETEDGKIKVVHFGLV